MRFFDFCRFLFLKEFEIPHKINAEIYIIWIWIGSCQNQIGFGENWRFGFGGNWGNWKLGKLGKLEIKVLEEIGK